MNASVRDPHLESFLEAIRPREWDLFSMSLHIARVGDPDFSHESCRQEMDRLRDMVAERLQAQDAYSIIESINAVLFDELGFRGNSDNYYDPLNSLMNHVLKRRTGIPITLSILYREIAGQTGLECWGVGMPGHFLLGFQGPSRQLFLDPFHGGQILLDEDCRSLVSRMFGSDFEFNRAYLNPVTNSAIALRMLMNLKQIYRQLEDPVKLLRVLNRRIPLLADPLSEILERGMTCVNLEEFELALHDFRHFVEHTSNESMRKLVESQIDELERLARRQ